MFALTVNAAVFGWLIFFGAMMLRPVPRHDIAV